MTGKWSLNWEEYPSERDIIIIPEISTFIVRYSEELSSEAFSKLSAGLNQIINFKTSGAATVTQNDDVFVVRTPAKNGVDIARYFEENDSKLEFMGKVKHQKREHLIHKTRISITSLSGNVRDYSGEPDFFSFPLDILQAYSQRVGGCKGRYIILQFRRG